MTWISVRLTKEDMASFRFIARAHGHKNLSSFVRSKIYDEEIRLREAGYSEEDFGLAPLEGSE